MVELSTNVRNALADTAFGLPHKRTYPMPDASQARKAQIDRKADELLGDA